MKVRLLFERRVVLAEDAFVELVLWLAPTPVEGSTHSYKYRLALVAAGECVIRYDNERGKGDHKHVGASEAPYRFKDPDRLVSGFFDDVTRWLDEDS